jgi:hypothetical protein
VRLFPVTADDGIDVHVNASYFQAQRVRQLQFVSKFGFHNILGGGGRSYAACYVPYLLPFSSSVLFFHLPHFL